MHKGNALSSKSVTAEADCHKALFRAPGQEAKVMACIDIGKIAKVGHSCKAFVAYVQ